MGLDLSHGNYGSPYSAFGNMRRWVARLAGYNLDEYHEYYTEEYDKQKRIAEGRIFPTKSLQDYPVLMADDLYILINHSDCEGEISPLDCAKLSIRMKQLVETKEAKLGGYYLQNALNFIEALDEAALLNEVLEFH